MRMRHEDVHFEKKKVSDEQRKKEECSQSKRSTCKNRACKIFVPKRQQKIVCGVIALLAMGVGTERLSLTVVGQWSAICGRVEQDFRRWGLLMKMRSRREGEAVFTPKVAS